MLKFPSPATFSITTPSRTREVLRCIGSTATSCSTDSDYGESITDDELEAVSTAHPSLTQVRFEANELVRQARKDADQLTRAARAEAEAIVDAAWCKLRNSRKLNQTIQEQSELDSSLDDQVLETQWQLGAIVEDHISQLELAISKYVTEHLIHDFSRHNFCDMMGKPESSNDQGPAIVAKKNNYLGTKVASGPTTEGFRRRVRINDLSVLCG